MLLSKATAATLADQNVRDKVGKLTAFVICPSSSLSRADIIISTPLRLVVSLQAGALDLKK